MATRTKNQNTYVHGDWNALCDRCGFKFKSSDLKKEWNGLMVCEDCWEQRHPADLYKYSPKEEQYIPWSRADNTGSSNPGSDINGNPIPPIGSGGFNYAFSRGFD